MIGDFNFDGVLTIEDVIVAQRIVDGTATVTEEILFRDTDGDNAITLADVLFVLHSLTQ